MSGDASSRTLVFDLDDDATPPGLAAPPREEGEIVALLAEDDLRAPGWAARASAHLGRGWAELGHRVLLADCDLDEPALHHVLEVPNGEGVSDAIAFGASLQRVSVEVEDGLRFISAGTVVADPAAIRADARWESILRRLRESGVVVLLHLPAGEGGVAALRDLADRVIRLGSGSDGSVAVDEVRLSPVSTEMVDTFAQGAVEREAGGGSASVAPTGDEGSPEAAGTSRAQAEPVAAGAGAAGPARAPKPRAASEPGRSGKGGPRPVKPRLTPWLLLVLVLVLVGSVVAHWLGVVEIPGLPIPVRAVSWIGAGSALTG